MKTKPNISRSACRVGDICGLGAFAVGEKQEKFAKDKFAAKKGVGLRRRMPVKCQRFPAGFRQSRLTLRVLRMDSPFPTALKLKVLTPESGFEAALHLLQSKSQFEKGDLSLLIISLIMASRMKAVLDWRVVS